MKILHVADIHIDADLMQAQKCCEFLLDTAKHEKVDLIVIAGDIYDHADVKLDSPACRYVFSWIARLCDVAPVMIVQGTPSHEGSAIAPLAYVKGRFPVVVADRPEIYMLGNTYMIKPLPARNETDCGIKALISTMPTPTKQMITQAAGQIQAENDQLANYLSPIFANWGAITREYDVPHIHAGHYCVRGAAISDTQVMVGRDIEIGRDQILMSNPDIACLGHIHLHQECFRDCYYSGSLIRKNRGETEEKGFYIHNLTTKESIFWVAPTHVFYRIREDFTHGEYDIENVIRSHAVLIPDAAYVKVEIKVWLDESHEIKKDTVISWLSVCNASNIQVQITRVPRQNIRSEEILKADRLRDKIKLLADQNREEKITAGILEKCDMLEEKSAEEILEKRTI